MPKAQNYFAICMLWILLLTKLWCQVRLTSWGRNFVSALLSKRGWWEDCAGELLCFYFCTSVSFSIKSILSYKNNSTENITGYLAIFTYLNQVLCFGNFLILIRDCGIGAELCRGRVSIWETHLSKLRACARQVPALQRGVCETTKTPSPCPPTHFKWEAQGYD